MLHLLAALPAGGTPDALTAANQAATGIDRDSPGVPG